MPSTKRHIVSVRVVDVVAHPGRRAVDREAVEKIAASIREIGLRTPITVRHDPDRTDYFLIAGRYRLEAVRSLGHEHIECELVEWDETQARLWETSENLHRADLTALERDEQIAEWIRLTQERRI